MVADFPSLGVLVYLQNKSKQNDLIWLHNTTYLDEPGGEGVEDILVYGLLYLGTEDGALSPLKISAQHCNCCTLHASLMLNVSAFSDAL